MGYFPDRFKTAITELIPEPHTDHTIPVNYRPVSLLDVPGKIVKKIINKKLRLYLETKNELPETQHGFRGQKGTDTRLTIITKPVHPTRPIKNDDK